MSDTKQAVEESLKAAANKKNNTAGTKSGVVASAAPAAMGWLQEQAKKDKDILDKVTVLKTQAQKLFSDKKFRDTYYKFKEIIDFKEKPSSQMDKEIEKLKAEAHYEMAKIVDEFEETEDNCGVRKEHLSWASMYIEAAKQEYDQHIFRCKYKYGSDFSDPEYAKKTFAPDFKNYMDKPTQIKIGQLEAEANEFLTQKDYDNAYETYKKITATAGKMPKKGLNEVSEIVKKACARMINFNENHIKKNKDKKNHEKELVANILAADNLGYKFSSKYTSATQYQATHDLRGEPNKPKF